MLLSRECVLVCWAVIASGCGADASTASASRGLAAGSTGTDSSDDPTVSTSTSPTTGISASATASASASGNNDDTSGSVADSSDSSGTTDSGTTASVVDTDDGTSTTGSGPETSTTAMTTDESTSTGVDPSMATIDPSDATEMGTTGSSSSSTSTGSCEQPPTDYDDCLNSGNGVCDEPNSSCLLDDVAMPTHGTCTALDCVDDCDCPAAPATGTAESVCGEILGDGGSACFLDCSGAATCPDGMNCIANTLCMWPDVECEDPPPAGNYGDCIADGTASCDNLSAICLQDDTLDPMFGVCAPEECETDCDCPAAPATGDAPVSCGAIVSGGGNACFLDCSSGQTCPDGMACFDEFVCMWSA